MTDLNLPPVDRDSHRPAYLQIAEHILEAIENGTLGPDAALPSKRVIGEQVGAAPMTVTAALDHLAARGHIVTNRGVVARVASAPPVLVVDADRWKALDARARWKRGDIDGREYPPNDDGIDWDELEMTVIKYSIEAAPPIVARRLGLDVGAPALRREFLEEAPGLSKRLRVSWLDAELVEGTAVADPDFQPWHGGTIDELYDLDQPATRVEQHVRARHATDAERAELGLPLAAPVLNLTRIFYAGDLGVETSDVVMEGAANAFACTVDL